MPGAAAVAMLIPKYASFLPDIKSGYVLGGKKTKQEFCRALPRPVQMHGVASVGNDHAELIVGCKACEILRNCVRLP